MKRRGISFSYEPSHHGSEREQEEPLSRLGLLLGHSQAMHDIGKLVQQIAAYPTVTVLLQGESGTGKDVVARSLLPFNPSSCASWKHIVFAASVEPKSCMSICATNCAIVSLA